MEIRVLKYFLAVAETGSVTAAARRVHVAQPSLSRQLRGLEAELGVDLFSRRPGSLTLSAAGRRFRPVAQDLVRRSEQAADAMAAAGRQEDVALTVVAPPATVTYMLAPYIAQGQAGPTLLDAVQEEPSRVFDTLLNSDADMGISTAPPPAPLESAFLGHTPVTAQVPVGHPWHGRDSVPLARLVVEPLMVMTRSNAARLVFDAALARDGLSAPNIHETGSSVFAQAMAAAGHGICLVTDGPQFDLRELVVLTGEGPMTVPLYAGWDGTHYARPSIKRLADGLKAYSAAYLRRFPGLPKQ